MQDAISNNIYSFTQNAIKNLPNLVIKDEGIFFNRNKEVNYEEEEEIRLVAHRGYSSKAPENTIEAIEAAAKNGYDAVEIDIDWTKDGVAVLMHDETLKRTSNMSWLQRCFGGNKCSHYTFEELREYDFGSWKGEEFKGTKIPSFKEALECAKENDLDLYIELKEGKGFTKERAKKLIEQIKNAGMEDKVNWISFEKDYLIVIKNEMPNARLGYITRKLNEDVINTLEELKTSENEVFLDIKAANVTEETIGMLNETGFEFEAWTVDDIEILKEMESYGCTGITTNCITQNDIK